MHSDCSALRNVVPSAFLQAWEEAGVEHVFLFPAHDLERGYDMPDAEVRAFERVIRPRLGG
jgi:5,10-methylenetetrahydromethanopterin reductase